MEGNRTSQEVGSGDPQLSSNGVVWGLQLLLKKLKVEKKRQEG